MVTCQACGTENPQGVTYCSQCARKLDIETQEAVARTRSSHAATGIHWGRVLYAVVGAVVLILVIAVVLVHVL